MWHCSLGFLLRILHLFTKSVAVTAGICRIYGELVCRRVKAVGRVAHILDFAAKTFKGCWALFNVQC